MTLSKKLDQFVSVYMEFLNSNKFQVINEMNSGMGCFIDYSNEFLCFRFINDRGICEVLIGGQNNRANLDFFDIDSIRILVLKLNGKLSKKHLETTFLYSWEDNFKWIVSNYSILVKSFSRNEVIQTKQALNEIRVTRTKIQTGT